MIAFLLLVLSLLFVGLVAATIFEPLFAGVKRNLNLIGCILALCHLSLVVCVVYLMLNSDDPEWPMLWLIFLSIDFPTSLLWVGASYVLPHFGDLHWATQANSPLNDMNEFLIPFFFTAVVGTAWWFFLPRIMIALVTGIRRRLSGECKA